MSEPGIVRVLVNPISGRRRRHEALMEAIRALRASGLDVEVAETRGPGHATEWASSLDESTRAVVGVGGDGTIRELVQGLAGGNVPLAIMPTGTENLLARQLGFRMDMRVLCDRIQTGRVQHVDVGIANGRYFVVVAGIGFDAEVVALLRRRRRGHITHASYFWPLWRTFWSHCFPPLRVEADGRLVHEGPGLVFVSNLPRYALGLRLSPKARYDDGQLDLCIYPCRSRYRLLIHSVRTLLQRHCGRSGVICCQCRHIRVSSDRTVPMQLDGDMAGSTPVDIRVLPARVPFLVSNRREGSGVP